MSNELLETLLKATWVRINYHIATENPLQISGWLIEK